ncbi:MAG: hypothetical protein ACJ8AG_18905 [Ktedonobacteraceae bacterium]
MEPIAPLCESPAPMPCDERSRQPTPAFPGHRHDRLLYIGWWV